MSRLVTKLPLGEPIQIGDALVRVTALSGGCARLVIEAPREVRVRRASPSPSEDPNA